MSSGKKILAIGLFLVLFGVWGTREVRAGVEYQRCRAGQDCVLGEYLFDDVGSLVTSQSCTIDIRNPSGVLVVNGALMTASSDGWHYYTVNLSSTNGLYRSLMSCTYGGSTDYLDKSFILGTRLEDVDSDVWGYSTRTMSSFGSLVSNIWSYSARSLSSFGSLVSNIWSNNTRTLTDADLDSGSIATSSAIISQTSEIKGVSDKSLTNVSDEIAAVQTTVDSIETKVVSLDSKVDTVDTNIDTVVSKWSTHSAAEIVGYVDAVESLLGNTTDTCVGDDTVLGNVQCVRDKWGDETADNIYVAANNAATISAQVRDFLDYVGKGSTVYDDIQLLKGYVDSVEVSLGDASDSATSATIFGRIKKVQDKVDQLDEMETDIDSILSKWGSYDAVDIYDKVKDLSLEISSVNTVTNVETILDLSKETDDDVDEVKNKLLAMKAVVDVNRQLMDSVANQPVIKTWMEEGSVIFKTLITNPSELYSQPVSLKYYLPKEVEKKDIMEMDEGVKVHYDSVEDALYISGDFKLKAGESRVLAVEVTDIWEFSEKELNSLRRQAKDLFEPLKGTAYFAQGSMLKNEVLSSLDMVESLQEGNYTPEAKISAYREGMVEIEQARNNLEDMEDLVMGVSSNKRVFGFVGGVQTIATWGIIIVLVAGFVFLGVFMAKMTRGVDKSKSKKTKTNKNKKGEEKKKVVKIMKLMGIGVLAGLSVIGSYKTYRYKQESKVEKKVAGVTVTAEKEKRSGSVESADDEKVEPEEASGSGELKNFQGKEIMVTVRLGQELNVREGPGEGFEVMGKAKFGERFREIARAEDKGGREWVKINLEGKGILPVDSMKDSGWVLSEFVIVMPKSQAQKD